MIRGHLGYTTIPTTLTDATGRRDKTGFAVEPRRWKIKPTFGCLQVTLR